MSLKIYNNIKIKIVGTLIGILILGALATLQLTLVLGEIKPTFYIIPTMLGGVSGFLVATWFSKLSKAKQEAQMSHSRLKLILKGTETGIWDWYLKTNKLILDEQWCRLLGYKMHEVEPIIESWKNRVHPDDLEQCYVDINRHLSGEVDFYNNIHRMQHKDGHWVYILDRGQVIERDANNQPLRFTGTHTDISYLKEIENALEETNKKLKRLSLKDGLTGLYNRRALDEHLLQEWGHWERNKTPLSILMIDIDLFKQFNDCYGHIAGDESLKQVAKTIKSTVHRKNDMVARYGGEEFLIILSGITQTEASVIAQEIHYNIEQLAIVHADSTVSSILSVSIGLNSCDSNRPCPAYHTLIDGADKALYEAKKQGRNKTVLYQAPDDTA